MTRPGALALATRPAVYRSRANVLPSCRPKSLRALQLSCSAAGPQGSFDNDDELEAGLSGELNSIADPEGTRFKQVAKHLDLLLKVSEKNQRPELCESCRGTGELECSWCHGTGVMTLGDTIYCDGQGCKACPVCRGLGQCKCERCRGTGRRAVWIDIERTSGYASS